MFSLDYYKKILLNLFYFFPILFILGPFFSDFYIIVIDIFLLIYIFFSKKKIDFYNKEIFLLFGLYIILLLSTFINSNIYEYHGEDFKRILISSFVLLRFPLFLIGILVLFQKDFNLQRFSKINFIILLILILSLIFEIIIGNDVFFTSNIMENRLSGLFRDELIVGSFFLKISMLSIPFILYYRIKSLNKINEKVFLLIYLLIVLFFVFLTGERISFLHSLIIFIFFIFLFKIINRFLIIFFLVFSISTILFLFNSIKVVEPYYKEAVGKTISLQDSTQYYLFNKKLDYNGSIFDRYFSLFLIAKTYRVQDYYILNKNAILLALERPLIGNGHKSFRILCSETNELINIPTTLKCSTHPHNLYVQIFSESGVLSITFFMLFLIIFLSKNYKQSKYENDKLLILFAFLIIYFNPLNITGNFFNNWYSSFFYYMMSVIFLFNYERKPNK